MERYPRFITAKGKLTVMIPFLVIVMTMPNNPAGRVLCAKLFPPEVSLGEGRFWEQELAYLYTMDDIAKMPSEDQQPCSCPPPLSLQLKDLELIQGKGLVHAVLDCFQCLNVQLLKKKKKLPQDPLGPQIKGLSFKWFCLVSWFGLPSPSSGQINSKKHVLNL